MKCVGEVVWHCINPAFALDTLQRKRWIAGRAPSSLLWGPDCLVAVDVQSHIHCNCALGRLPQVTYGPAMTKVIYTPPSLLLQMHCVRPTIRHKNINNFLHHIRCVFNSDLTLDSNLASRLGNPRIGPGRTAQLSILPILVCPALWILTQASLIFMGTVTLATLLLWRRLFVIARMLNGRFGSRRRRARIVCGFSR